MAANPVTFQEIQAFDQLNRLRLKPWEVRLLERLDDIALAAHDARAKAAQAGEPDADDTMVSGAPIPITDVKRMKAMLRGLAANKGHLGPDGQPIKPNS